MKERPILFSGEMVRAILDGRKTMTRRVVKPQPFFNYAGFLAWKTSGCLQNMGRTAEEMLAKHCPYGQPGDRLWVRETISTPMGAIVYRADLNGNELIEIGGGRKYHWTPSIHMPRWASRVNLEISDVRVEPLNIISNQDIIREGVRSESCNICVHSGGSGCEHCFSLLNNFRDLWDLINGRPRKDGQDISWSANPFVWVVSFKVMSA
jgi:hypothetical protein